ncbi:MAG TPA: hypothetical protein PKV86_12210 [Syntrophobacteraceae bacterium]|nr:hypothetical protein [Syntrophobacteraceae bacterium]
MNILKQTGLFIPVKNIRQQDRVQLEKVFPNRRPSMTQAGGDMNRRDVIAECANGFEDGWF